MSKASYGVDAPGVVMGFAAGGLVSLALCYYTFWWLASAAWFFWSAASMLRGSFRGKFKVRDRLLDFLSLQGSEKVLDVGCGRGLILLGAAKRLPGGKAVGVDIWQTKDQSGNSPETTLRNAAAEGVSGRIELNTADAAKLPFDSSFFDAVTSSLAIHNIPKADARAAAIREMVRVLKPGGKLAVYDIFHVGEYEKTLAESGMKEIVKSKRIGAFYKDNLLTALKPN
ncbi:MAG TPA: class I SAM-dependent methyltransferase [Elusimicrobiota bacterium]|nr:class I SAM-dependent methyltransferase [Elusimicrobiota bacterium]